jgi:lipoprotein-anchoring transpeptidase ErfK/SrfK
VLRRSPYRTIRPSPLAVVLSATAILAVGCKRDLSAGRTDSDSADISFPADSMRREVVVTPALRGDTSWRAAAEADRRRRHPTATPATIPAPVVLPDSETLADLAPERVNATPRRPVLAGEGPTVLRAQILLDQAGFSPGAFDGAWGANTSKAAFWFQDAAGLPVTGFVDAATFDALRRRVGNAAGVVRYAVTAADVAGPFVKIPDTPYDQAELDCLCYESAWEGLAERFHSTPELLAQLNPGVDSARVAAGTQLWVPNVTRPALPPASTATAAAGDTTARAVASPAVARIVVSKRGSYVQALDSAGRILMHFPSTLGSTYDPSPAGDFHVTRVAFRPDFHYNPALYAEVPDSRPDAHLPAGPNAPVGVVWMALSKPHYGIHGTSSPATIGYADSHGCVRLTNWDANWLAQHTGEGVPVEFER